FRTCAQGRSAFAALCTVCHSVEATNKSRRAEGAGLGRAVAAGLRMNRATMNQHVPANHALADRLAREIEGEVLFDRFSRGRYATDASIYQIEPVGVVVPKTIQDVRIAAQIAREAGVPLLPRGGATSQSGQTVGRALVVDFAKNLTRVLEVDREARTCLVEPGIALDELNRQLKATGLFFPVDVSTSSRAT